MTFCHVVNCHFAFLSFCYFAIWHFILTGDESVRQKALDTAQKAVEIAPTSGFAQGKLGWVLTFLRRYDEALDRFESAIVLSPNDADIFGDYGEVLNYVGKPEKGLEMIEHGMRIDPLGPASWDFHRGHSYYKMQRYDEAITAIRHSISRNPSFPVTYLFLAVIYSELGQDEKAVEMVNNARKRVPKYSIETLSKIIVHKSEAEMDRFLTGLRAAGMPEC